MTEVPGRHARQVNIRLKPADAEVLSAVAFVSDCSAAEVLRPVVERFLLERRTDPGVEAALRARLSHGPFSGGS